MFYHLFIKLIYYKKLREVKINKYKNNNSNKRDLQNYIIKLNKKLSKFKKFVEIYRKLKGNINFRISSEVNNLINKYNKFVLAKFIGKGKIININGEVVDTAPYAKWYNEMKKLWDIHKTKLRELRRQKKSRRKIKQDIRAYKQTQKLFHEDNYKILEKMSLNKIEKFEEFEKYLLGQYKAMNPLRLKKSKSLSLIKKECKKLSEEDKKIYIEKVKKKKKK